MAPTVPISRIIGPNLVQRLLWTCYLLSHVPLVRYQLKELYYSKKWPTFFYKSVWYHTDCPLSKAPPRGGSQKCCYKTDLEIYKWISAKHS